jgi:type IV secretory pathway TraG/TraD family ATPase VirD4
MAKVLSDRALRDNLLSERSEGDLVRQFFEYAQKTSGDQNLHNWVPYIASKINRFVHNPLIERMLCSPIRTINFREIIDNKRILLVNLAKGDIGPQDASLIGLLLSNYMFAAALERGDAPRDRRTPFYFYLDEFQNFTTGTIAGMLAEARKYGLHLILAHQTLSQLISRELSHPRALLDAVLGNVGSKLFMRVGLEDAAILESQCLPQFSAKTLSQLPDGHVVSRLLFEGRPSSPFVFSTLPAVPPSVRSGQEKHVKRIRALSRERYGLG